MGYGPWGLKGLDRTEATENRHRGKLLQGSEEKWHMFIYILKESLCFCVEIRLYGGGKSVWRKESS